MICDFLLLLSYTEHKPAAALPYVEQGLRCVDDDFSVRLVTRLCHTLRRDMHG